MLSQKNPIRPTAAPACASGLALTWSVVGEAPAGAGSAWSAGAYGPLRVEHHLAARRQGTRLDPGFGSLRARPRRLRRALLLSGARPAGDRCGRPCAARRDRDPDVALPAVLGRARGIPGGALRQERDHEGRRGGPG